MNWILQIECEREQEHENEEHVDKTATVRQPLKMKPSAQDPRSLASKQINLVDVVNFHMMSFYRTTRRYKLGITGTTLTGI
jgi:hypothetical protein